MKKYLLLSFLVLFFYGCSFKPTLIELPVPYHSSINEDIIQTSKLIDEDINREFDNIIDLGFLKPIAKNNKVVFIGENHYFQSIHFLRNRILFALNTYDYYHLVSLEKQYSVTPFFNYYVNLSDQTEANKFYMTQIYNMVTTKELKTLLDRVRLWNIKYPAKKISVSGHDIEHDYNTTIRDILIPYFKNVDSSLVYSQIQSSELDSLINSFRQLLPIAKGKKIIGQYDFLTPQYIETVLENLESLYFAYNKKFNYYRQNAIIRNLTDDRFLGNYINTGKILLHGGGYHTPTKRTIKKGQKYYREGVYLNQIYPSTKGKCYSILARGLSYNFSNTASTKTSDILHHGRGYRNLINSFQEMYINENDSTLTNEYFYPKYYFTQKPYNSLTAFLFKLGEKQNANIYKIDYMNQNELLKKSKIFEYFAIKNYISESNEHDLNIFVLRSNILTTLLKKNSSN